MAESTRMQARDTSLVLISRAPVQKLLAFREQMGWDFPWYSSFRSDFNFDFGATDDEGEHHVASVFLRDGDDVCRTYFTWITPD